MNTMFYMIRYIYNVCIYIYNIYMYHLAPPNVTTMKQIKIMWNIASWVTDCLMLIERAQFWVSSCGKMRNIVCMSTYSYVYVYIKCIWYICIHICMHIYLCICIYMYKFDKGTWTLPPISLTTSMSQPERSLL
jgi:hypothetical protein